KFRSSQFLMAATASVRPALVFMSIARPRLIPGGVTEWGLPSISSKWLFMLGKALIAWTMAYPMRCVNEILPPCVRLRWLLITTRLSIIALAGTARTEVAVGSDSDAFMFLTIAFAGPRKTLCSVSSGGLYTGASGSFGAGASGFLLVAGARSGAGTPFPRDLLRAGASAGGFWDTSSRVASGVTSSIVTSADFRGAASEPGASPRPAPLPPGEEAAPGFASKNSCQVRSTEDGS